MKTLLIAAAASVTSFFVAAPVVADVPSDRLDLVGLALHGPKNAVDKVVKGARLHP